MEENSKPKIIMLILSIIAVTLFLSCEQNAFDGDIKDGNRDIIIDVDNTIFDAIDEVDFWERGPGVDKIVLTITLGGADNLEAIMETVDIDSTYRYTQLTIPVIGKLTRIDAMAYTGSTLLFSISIEDKSALDSFYGWEIFANVKKFKLGFHGNTDDPSNGFLILDVAPRGGNSVTFKNDSGVTAISYQNTDWAGDPLISRQIAMEPILNENPTGLTFDIYTLVVDSNIREEYDPDLNDEANYEYYPWEDLWTYKEITETGKLIGDTTYKLTKYNTLTTLDFIEPDGDGCGYDSFLIDLTSEAEDPSGKFLLVSLVMKYDTLSVQTAVELIGIK